MRYRELDISEEDMIMLARRLGRADFISYFVPYQREPRIHYVVYDGGEAIASFGEDHHIKKYSDMGYEVRKIVPSRQKVVSYRIYLRRREDLGVKYDLWASEGRLSEWYGFKLADVHVYHHRDDNTFTANWKGRRVGQLTIDLHQKDDPVDVRKVFNVGVKDELQRRGIATLLYDAAENYLSKLGQHLEPSKTQHPGGHAFWNSGNHPRRK